MVGALRTLRKVTWDDRYDRYVKPLEADNQGRFFALTFDGQVIFNDDYSELVREAMEKFGVGGFEVSRVGEDWIEAFIDESAPLRTSKQDYPRFLPRR